MSPETRGKRRTTPAGGQSKRQSGPRCALCGKTRNLTQTECCGYWICNDEDRYVLFSYARNSCRRNHRRYTLCGYHHAAGHDGAWQHCPKCREEFDTELYVYFGTNEYNVEKLPDPPGFEPTHCRKCQARIRLGEDGYSVTRDGYLCERCAAEFLASLRARKS